MPEIQLYVTEADRAWLDSQPATLNVSALLREAIALRRSSACDHPVRLIRCDRCGADLGYADVESALFE